MIRVMVDIRLMQQLATHTAAAPAREVEAVVRSPTNMAAVKIEAIDFKKMLGLFATTSRLTSIHQMSLAVLSRAACASMSTMTTTTRDRGDRYGPMEWAQWRHTTGGLLAAVFVGKIC